ncbi:hypothetical protein GIB67_035044 [Kingdonia uniflora]|uniref:Uncharacterized protein n=1 Tax=Kingdonia uniflora TaxID=39325 RepID=A0A7J7L1I2_9MAGN|nr:hypothetical protein GIB67_035044 [Kingdonia uniflora]
MKEQKEFAITRGMRSSIGMTKKLTMQERRIHPNSKHEKNYLSETGGNATDAVPSVHWHISCPKQQPKLYEEEKAARLREMQLDAELHEENRWKRLKMREWRL